MLSYHNIFFLSTYFFISLFGSREDKLNPGRATKQLRTNKRMNSKYMFLGSDGLRGLSGGKAQDLATKRSGAQRAPTGTFPLEKLGLLQAQSAYIRKKLQGHKPSIHEKGRPRVKPRPTHDLSGATSSGEVP